MNIIKSNPKSKSLSREAEIRAAGNKILCLYVKSNFRCRIHNSQSISNILRIFITLINTSLIFFLRSLLYRLKKKNNKQQTLRLNYSKMSTSGYVLRICISKFCPHNTLYQRNVYHILMPDTINI